MLRILSVLLLCASFSLSTQAGTYVGGDIRFISEEGSTVVDFEVYMYSFFSGLDSEDLELCLSNGECLTLNQTTEVEQVRYELYRYRYDISYDLEEFGFYRAWLIDTKLPDGICNVNFPNSGAIPFYTELQF
ncbi:MAG: hypothetical protein AAGH79_08980 [Bacteroidota bacterium]